MGYAVVRYSVKDGSAEENRALIVKAFEELDQSAPQGLRYLVLELEGGEFVHVVMEEGVDSTLPKLAAFKAFTAHHADRRSTPISRSAAKVVGNYRMIEEGKLV